MKDLIKILYKNFDGKEENQNKMKKIVIKEFKKEISNISDNDLADHLTDVRYSIVNKKFSFTFEFALDKE